MERPNMEREASRLELANVTFTGAQPKSEMCEYLAAADACVATLKNIPMYRTTYPNKIFDYMAAGRPVVLAIDGVIRQVVEDADCGIFAQPGNPVALADAIRTIAADKDEARRMGLAGRQYLEEHFSRERMAEKLLGILSNLSHPE
jgi:glycosyltransferase involved in cell wall biosynthesis